MILETWRFGVKEKNFGQQAQMMVMWILWYFTMMEKYISLEKIIVSGGDRKYCQETQKVI